MTKWVTRLRFLTVAIFAAVLMLTVKLSSLWDDVDGFLNGTITVAVAVAQQPTAGGTEPLVPGPDQPQADEAAQPPAGDAAEQPLGGDLTLLTQTEIDLLQQLAERREVLEDREQEMDMRSGLLSAAESRIDKKVEELKLLQNTIQKLIRTYDQQQDAQLQSLVKIYENMKPKDAARIFEELDMDTLLLVIERMKERKLAPVMASMDPSKAMEITVELTRLRKLPPPGSNIGG